MFERGHHRSIALVLQSLDPAVLARWQCWFGGGTAMALLHGEYRESNDIDFLVSDPEGYRALRQALGGVHGLTPLVRPGLELALAREVRTDQYGIRTQVRAGVSVIKFEIVREARILFEPPGPTDVVCGVATLAPVDLAAGKLLANADRWADDAVHSRDLIDLALQPGGAPLLRRACAKAEAAYGNAVRAAVRQAIDALQRRPDRLGECMRALAMQGMSKAQLWQAIRRVGKALA